MAIGNSLKLSTRLDSSVPAVSCDEHQTRRRALSLWRVTTPDTLLLAQTAPIGAPSITKHDTRYQRCVRALGSVSVALSPPGAELFKLISPPYKCARSRTIGSPRPDPGTWSSRRSPILNTRCSASAGNPGPSSSTAITTLVLLSSRRPRITTEPTAHLHALSIRFASISLRSIGSHNATHCASTSVEM